MGVTRSRMGTRLCLRPCRRCWGSTRNRQVEGCSERSRAEGNVCQARAPNGDILRLSCQRDRSVMEPSLGCFHRNSCKNSISLVKGEPHAGRKPWRKAARLGTPTLVENGWRRNECTSAWVGCNSRASGLEEAVVTRCAGAQSAVRRILVRGLPGGAPLGRAQFGTPVA
jgi:hypothetical protein